MSIQSCRKINLTIILTVFILSKLTFSTYGQTDSSFFHSVGLSFSALSALVDENAVVLDIKPHKYFSIGFGMGQVHKNPSFIPNPVSGSQDINPGMVYDGIAKRLFLKVFFYDHDNIESYFGLNIVKKDLSYENMEFYDSYGDTGSKTYIRNEKKKVKKMLFMVGSKINFPLSEKIKMSGDMYLGAGNRKFTRDIDNIRYINEDSTGDEYIQQAPPDEIRKYENPALLVGLDIGIRYFF